MDTKVAVVVPAAGRGTRFGNQENKIWVSVGGRSLLEWTLSAFQGHHELDTIVVAAASPDLPRVHSVAQAFTKIRAIVEGGATRQESVGNGLASVPSDCGIVLVHDAARPAVSAALISRVIEGVRRHGAAVPGLQISDSIKRIDSNGAIAESIQRHGLYAVQTPQGVLTETLRAAYARLGERVAQMTDEAGILEAAGYPAFIVPGEESNLKVTAQTDMERIVLAQNSDRVRDQVRTGFGYDVHAFAEGRPLWLGGVEIPHDRGLLGHSDADVALHAICDALLGAAGLGDIGVLFPDTDQAHKNRKSHEFLHEVRARLDAAGYSIVNVDVALLAETPRIGPYRERMIAVIADSLQLASTRVNIKATTSEKMGFVGRREGIACWAVATITPL